jgi:DNA processing protein
MSDDVRPPNGRLSDEQLVDWLRLIRSENIGPRTFRQLINRYGGAAAALEALPALAARSLKGRAIRIADRDEALREIERSQALGVRFIVMSDPEYPALLREIADAPPLIALRGAASLTRRACVAIVGSRNASASGLAFTERLARGLGHEDYVIVSGLARGIDAVAHRASLETGAIAVLAGGHARPYPSEHASLLEKIVESGAVISEMPLEWEPRGRDFPRRNRIISGLSEAVVVVEAARRSGSLITARFANEQGREIFAVPGSPLDPRAEGTNDLIRQGATLCMSAEDVIRSLAGRSLIPAPRVDLFDEADGVTDDEPLFDELDLFSLQDSASTAADFIGAPQSDEKSGDEPPSVPARDPPEPAPVSDPRAVVLSLLGPSPVAIDELIRIAGLPARDVHGVLVELDLAGRLERHGANSVSLLL